MILSEIFRALSKLFIAAIVLLLGFLGYEATKNVKLKEALRFGFLLCAGLSFFMGITLGEPTCEIVGDPLYGGCEYYADDGFIPTTKERVANFIYYMTLLYLPMVVGALLRHGKAPAIKQDPNSKI